MGAGRNCRGEECIGVWSGGVGGENGGLGGEDSKRGGAIGRERGRSMQERGYEGERCVGYGSGREFEERGMVGEGMGEAVVWVGKRAAGEEQSEGVRVRRDSEWVKWTGG